MANYFAASFNLPRPLVCSFNRKDPGANQVKTVGSDSRNNPETRQITVMATKDYWVKRRRLEVAAGQGLEP